MDQIELQLQKEEQRRAQIALEIVVGGLVLLVDDDPTIRALAKRILERLGFCVLEAKDGIEAMELFRQHRNTIRFVMCDLVMPRMDGWETLRALRQLAPDIPVILTSGCDLTRAHAGSSRQPHSFLPKPYGSQGLREMVRQVLGTS